MVKSKVKGLGIFLAGFAAAVALMVGVFVKPDARADAYSCIRQDLDASGMNGNIPDPEFTITYAVPDCYRQNGDHVEKVFIYGGDMVAVRYAKGN